MMTPTAFARGCREVDLAVAPASAELRSADGLAPFGAGSILTLHSPITHQLSQQADR